MTFTNGMKALGTFYSPVRDFQTRVTLVYGAPGTGKTRFAISGPGPTYVLPCYGSDSSTDFFGDYRPDYHQTVLVDDFYNSWKYTTFLRVCDRYPTEVQTKGGFAQLLARDVVFTSNLHPMKWYPKVLADPDRRESFFRRVHCIVEITKDFYILRKGDLPWPLPFLRAANALDLLNFPNPSGIHPPIVPAPPQAVVHAALPPPSVSLLS